MLRQYKNKISHADMVSPDAYVDSVSRIIAQANVGGASAKLKCIGGAAVTVGIDNGIDYKSFCELMDDLKDTYKALMQNQINKCQ